jgi:hypothetical protein
VIIETHRLLARWDHQVKRFYLLKERVVVGLVQREQKHTAIELQDKDVLLVLILQQDEIITREKIDAVSFFCIL